MFTYNSTGKTYVRMLGKRTDDSTGRNRLERVEKGWLAMAGFIQRLRSRLVLRIAALATAGIAVSGCTYDVGLGYASDGYGYGGGSGYYDCDPYSPFDNYYDCDNGYGYSNIGYGGGWYDNLWYPGYGFFLFDIYGQRYNMRDSHRRYWGERRHRWYRENRGRNRDGGRHEGRGYTDSATPGAMDRSESYDRRMREGDDYRNGRGDGRRQHREQRRGNDVGVDAILVPDTGSVRGGGLDNGEGYGRRQSPDDGSVTTAPAQMPERPAAGRSQVRRDSESVGYLQPPRRSSGQSEALVEQPQ